MDTLPNRDTVAAFEARLGPKLMTVLIWLLAAGLAVGALSVIIAGVRGAWAFFYPLMPAGSWWTEFAVNIGAAIVATFLAVLVNYVAKVLKAVRRVAVSHEATVNVLGAESERVEMLTKRLDGIEGRFEYVEKKVGDELTDTLTKTLLEQADKRYYVRVEDVPPPPLDPRVELGQKLLRDAAQQLRYAFKCARHAIVPSRYTVAMRKRFENTVWHD